MYYSPKAFLPESLRLLMDTVAGSIRNYEMHILEPNWKSHNKSNIYYFITTSALCI